MSPVNPKKIFRQAMAEFIGMTLFVYVGTGSVISTGQQLTADGAPNAAVIGRILPIAFGFGISIVVQAYSFGHVSGGHFNPAVTLCLGLAGRCDNMVQMAAFMLSQFSGATLGSLLLWASTNSLSDDRTGLADRFVGNPPFQLGANGLNSDLNQANGFLLEFMGTTILLCCVLATAVESKSLAHGAPHMAPLAIGLAVFLAHIVLIPLTGCGINPARTFGPAVVNLMGGTNVWESSYWIYFIGPFCASFMSAMTYKHLIVHHKDEDEAELKKDVDPTTDVAVDECMSP